MVVLPPPSSPSFWRSCFLPLPCVGWYSLASFFFGWWCFPPCALGGWCCCFLLGTSTIRRRQRKAARRPKGGEGRQHPRKGEENFSLLLFFDGGAFSLSPPSASFGWCLPMTLNVIPCTSPCDGGSPPSPPSSSFSGGSPPPSLVGGLPSLPLAAVHTSPSSGCGFASSSLRQGVRRLLRPWSGVDHPPHFGGSSTPSPSSGRPAPPSTVIFPGVSPPTHGWRFLPPLPA